MKRSRNSKTEADSASPESSFDRFTSLTKRLVSVPKKEIGQRAKAHEQKKRARS